MHMYNITQLKHHLECDSLGNRRSAANILVTYMKVLWDFYA